MVTRISVNGGSTETGQNGRLAPVDGGIVYEVVVVGAHHLLERAERPLVLRPQRLCANEKHGIGRI